MMIEKYYILAMFTQALFPIVVLVKMFIGRIRALQTGAVPARYFKSYQLIDKDAPEDIVVTARHYTNLFEMPMLFLILGTLLISLQLVTKTFLFFAWLYVLLRLIHTIIHLGHNKIVHRLTAFAASCIVLLGMWIGFIGKIFLS